MNKEETPLAPSKDDNLGYLIWQELRMLNMGITNIEAKLDETNKRISEIDHRLLTVYDFDSGVNKLCDKLSTIGEQLK